MDPSIRCYIKICICYINIDYVFFIFINITSWDEFLKNNWLIFFRKCI